MSGDSLLRRLPSPLIILVVTSAAMLAIVTWVHGLADTDYWWHFTTGQVIAQTGRVPSVDPYSFTYGGQPWTAHEWLGELLLYELVSWLGTTLTLLAFGVISALGLATVAVALRRLGVPTLAIAVGVGIGTWILFGFSTPRPQVISFAFMGILVGTLLVVDVAHRRWLILLPPFFALWANLHGLWVVGLGVLFIHLVFTLAGRTPLARARRWALAVAVACVAATMATPAGIGGVLYPLRYIQPNDWGLAHISEWMSPNFHETTFLPLLLLVLLVVGVGARGVPGWLTALALLGVVMALFAQRNAPLAGILAMPAVAMGLASVGVHSLTGADRRQDAMGRRLMELALAAVVVIGAGVIAPRVPAAAAVAETSFPVAAVDQLVAVQPQARLFTEYEWGGYAIYRLYHLGGRVFVDGRNDMYPRRILDDYVTIRGADPGWQDLLRSYGVTAVILRPQTPLVAGPLKDAGWCVAYRDQTAVLMLPTCP